MAVVRGPLFSLQARKQIGKELVYYRSKGQNIVREYVVPANPRTTAQQAQRASFGALAKMWVLVSQFWLEPWAESKPRKFSTPRAWFDHYNIEQLRTGRAPTRNYPAQNGNFTVSWNFPAGYQSGDVLQFEIYINFTPRQGCIVWASNENGFTPSPSNIVAVEYSQGTTEWFPELPPYPNEVNYGRAQIWDDDGNVSQMSDQFDIYQV